MLVFWGEVGGEQAFGESGILDYEPVVAVGEKACGCGLRSVNDFHWSTLFLAVGNLWHGGLEHLAYALKFINIFSFPKHYYLKVITRCTVVQVI